jgi:hypothetical protein
MNAVRIWLLKHEAEYKQSRRLLVLFRTTATTIENGPALKSHFLFFDIQVIVAGPEASFIII